MKTVLSVDVFTVFTLCSRGCSKIWPPYCPIFHLPFDRRSLGLLAPSNSSKIRRIVNIQSVGLALLTAKFANVDLLPGIASVRGASRAIPWVVE